VVATPIPTFVCPSCGGENPYDDFVLTFIFKLYPSSPNQCFFTPFGTTTYVFCKGVTDAICPDAGRGRPGPPYVPISERGMFDINWAVNAKKVTDGLSNTLAVGEGTYGPAWQVTDTNSSSPASQRVITYSPEGQIIDPRVTIAPGYQGQARTPWQCWAIGLPSYKRIAQALPLHFASVLACTLEPLNKNPVTQSLADEMSLSNPNKSGPSAPGTRGATTNNGAHFTSNFRSDHSGGGNFLFADGSVHFISEDISMLLYQQLSTMMGGEVAEIPE
jgi:prepilin-type processing-associated H-X9-DG protein